MSVAFAGTQTEGGGLNFQHHLYAPESCPRPAPNGFLFSPPHTLIASSDESILHGHVPTPFPCLPIESDDSSGDMTANTSIATANSDSPGPATPEQSPQIIPYNFGGSGSGSQDDISTSKAFEPVTDLGRNIPPVQDLESGCPSKAL